MLFDSTLRRDLARSFGATLVVILTIVLTMMLIRTLGLAAGGRVSPQDVVLLLGYAALGHLPTMLNAVAVHRRRRDARAHVPRQRDGDLVRQRRRPGALRAPGAAHSLAGAGWPSPLLTLFVWPWGNRNSTELKDRYERRSDLSRVAPGQFQTSSDGRRVFFIERDSQDGRTGRNVFILASSPLTESVTSARTGHIELQGEDRFLRLERGQRNEQDFETGEKTLARFETYRVLVGERALAGVDDLPPRARGTPGAAAPSRRRATRASWPGGSACCSVRPTCCCWRFRCRPRTRAAPATGTCCSRCSPSSSTST